MNYILRTDIFRGDQKKMTNYGKEINRAMNAQKKYYGHECIFSGHHEEMVIGAHVFKRGSHPELANMPENIYPLSPDNDRTLEKIADPWKRICIILHYVHASHEEKVRVQIDTLITHIINKEFGLKGELT